MVSLSRVTAMSGTPTSKARKRHRPPSATIGRTSVADSVPPVHAATRRPGSPGSSGSTQSQSPSRTCGAAPSAATRSTKVSRPCKRPHLAATRRSRPRATRRRGAGPRHPRAGRARRQGALRPAASAFRGPVVRFARFLRRRLRGLRAYAVPPPDSTARARARARVQSRKRPIPQQTVQKDVSATWATPNSTPNLQTPPTESRSAQAGGYRTGTPATPRFSSQKGRSTVPREPAPHQV